MATQEQTLDQELIDSYLINEFGVRYEYPLECYNVIQEEYGIPRKQCLAHRRFRFKSLEELLQERSPDTIYNIYKKYKAILSDDEFTRIHSVYNFSKSDVRQMFTVLCRGLPKRRSVLLYGPSNTGKSILANALMFPFAPGYIQRDGGTNVHWLEHIYRRNFILWEEPSIHMSNVEDAKLLLGGERLAINRKNKEIIERINDPAVVVTTNREIWLYGGEAIKNRCLIFQLHRKVSQYLQYPHEIWLPQSILGYLCDLYDGRRDPRDVDE